MKKKSENSVDGGLLCTLLAALIPIAVIVLMTQIGTWNSTAPPWLTIMLVSLIAIVLSYLFSRPYRKAVLKYRAAQCRLEEGDFTVRVDMGKTVAGGAADWRRI